MQFVITASVKCQKLGQSIFLTPYFPYFCVAFRRLFDVLDQNELKSVSDRLFELTKTSFFKKI